MEQIARELCVPLDEFRRRNYYLREKSAPGWVVGFFCITTLSLVLSAWSLNLYMAITQHKLVSLCVAIVGLSTSLFIATLDICPLQYFLDMRPKPEDFGSPAGSTGDQQPSKVPAKIEPTDSATSIIIHAAIEDAHHEIKIPVDSPKELRELLATGNAPLVDLLCPCCGESLDIVQDTVRACLNQTYPHDRYCVYVLDDGGDDKLKAWVEEDCKELVSAGRLMYIRRDKTPGVPHCYKAGNMNHALKLTSSPYIAQLDADMIPCPQFLALMLTDLLRDPQAAYCYCPETMYNCGPMDMLDDNKQECRHFMWQRIKMGMNTGSGVIWRRRAIMDSDGFRTESQGEDFMTSTTLIAKYGWRTLFHRTPLQTGLVPWSCERWLRQHHRWFLTIWEMLELLFWDVLRSPYLGFKRRWVLMCILFSRFTPITVSLLLLCTGVSIVGPSLFADPGKSLFVADCTLLRVTFWIWAAAGVVGSTFGSLCYTGMPSPFLMFARMGMLTFWELPHNFVWLMKHFCGRKHTWRTTGRSQNTTRGWRALWNNLHFFWMHLAFLVGYGVVAIGLLVLKALQGCTNPVWWVARCGMVATLLPYAAATAALMYHFAWGMPSQDQRLHLVPCKERGKDGTPIIDALDLADLGRDRHTAFTREGTVLAIVLAGPTVVSLVVAWSLAIAGTVFPPSVTGGQC